jgi:hypothetical protein
MRLTQARFVLAAISALVVTCVSTATAQPIVSGGNFAAPSTELDVPWLGLQTEKYQVNASIIHDPSAGPIVKHFASPPTTLVDSQPFPLVINENITIVSEGVPSPHHVTDWHEAIFTKGWVWYLPGDPGSAGWFPEGTTLITRDGQPWASTVQPGPNPLILDVVFDPIEPGHILDIHKALLWVGNGTNTIWGDDPDETFIEVREYPTPEPGSIVLAGLAAVLVAVVRKRFR